MTDRRVRRSGVRAEGAVRNLVRVLVAVGLTALRSWQSDPGAVWRAARGADWRFILLACAWWSSIASSWRTVVDVARAARGLRPT